MTPSFSEAAEARPVAFTKACLVPGPDAEPIRHGTLLVRDGRIAALGEGIPVPSDADEVDLSGATVTAGFWNAHVHFTEGHWARAGRQRASVLEGHLTEMLTRWGFTTVVDTGSDPRSTFPLRARVATGEVRGPTILSAGTGFYPPHGLPYYIRGELPWYAAWFIPQPASPRAAARAARRSLDRGADLVKLFTGSYVARGTVLPMPEPVARAAVAVAHARGRPVFAHPSDLAGTRVALASGVDVLAHAPDATDGIDDDLLRQLVARSIRMIPTLHMFATTVTSRAEYLDPIYDVVRRFRRLNGTVVFGTDVGYFSDYSTAGEFAGLAKAGLDGREVLRALTTAPAQVFPRLGTSGRLVPGAPADLTVLDGDPWEDLGAYARVRRTVRSGRTIWRAG